MKKIAVITGLTAALTFAVAGVCSAAPFVINQTFSQGGGLPDLGSATINLPGGDSCVVDPGASGEYLDFTFGGGFGTFSTIATQISGYYFLRSYDAGDVIGTLNFGDEVSTAGDWDTILVNGVTAGAWGADHSGFLGFRDNTHHYGWIRYNFTLVGNVSSIELLDGAINEDVRVDIIAGGVAAPEPASLALLGLGMTALVSRRLRKRN